MSEIILKVYKTQIKREKRKKAAHIPILLVALYRTQASSEELLSQLSSLAMSEEEKSMLRTMEAVNMMIGTLLDKLETKNGTSHCLSVLQE